MRSGVFCAFLQPQGTVNIELAGVERSIIIANLDQCSLICTTVGIGVSNPL